MKEAQTSNIALFASGNGTNVQRICEYFRANHRIHPVVLFCNNPNAFVLERAKNLNIPQVVISQAQLNDEAFMRQALQKHGVTHIVLAGFLALVPAFLVKDFSGRIVNIHPALLPKFGGKGMYGHHVHKAVLEAGEKESGITIHLVNGAYDQGEILFQASCAVDKADTPDSLAEKIHALEQRHFAPVLEQWLQWQLTKKQTY